MLECHWGGGNELCIIINPPVVGWLLRYNLCLGTGKRKFQSETIPSRVAPLPSAPGGCILAPLINLPGGSCVHLADPPHGDNHDISDTPPPPHKRLTLLAAALVALVLALPAGEVHAQAVEQSACPNGVSQKDHPFLTVTVGPNRGSTYNPDTHQFTTDTTRYSARAEVTENAKGFLVSTREYTYGQFRFGMQGEGEGLLHHGVMWSAGRLRNGQFEGVGPINFHNLEPGTKYAVEFHVENSNLYPERRLLFLTCFQTPPP